MPSMIYIQMARFIATDKKGKAVGGRLLPAPRLWLHQKVAVGGFLAADWAHLRLSRLPHPIPFLPAASDCFLSWEVQRHRGEFGDLCQ